MSAETSVEHARAQGQWAQASVELEEWVKSGRQLVSDAQQAPWAQRQPSAGNRGNIPLYPLGFGLDLAGAELV